MSSSVWALIENGTSCKVDSRFVAVTTTRSITWDYNEFDDHHPSVMMLVRLHLNLNLTMTMRSLTDSFLSNDDHDHETCDVFSVMEVVTALYLVNESVNVSETPFLFLLSSLVLEH